MPAPSLKRAGAPEADASPVRFRAEAEADTPAVDALIARAFGPGRYAKTAERLREGAAFHPELSICAWTGARLLGAVRLWPARIGGADALFLGPIAVDSAMRRHGLGGLLVQQACERACARGERVVILVGDMGFFGPLGFEPVPARRVALPGPVDPARVLWRALTAGALDGLAGRLRAQAPA